MPATSSARLTLARIRIGEVGIGIRIEAVLQALPLPETFSRLPLRTHALLGMVEHDGMAVPVVDLARWLDVGAAPAGAVPQLLLLRDGDRTVGLRVDALEELVEVEAAALQRLHHGDDPDDVFHSAAPSGNGVLLSLLEVTRLADLAQCWSTAPTSGAPAALPVADTLPRTCYALLDTGHGLIGVPPAALAEVLALPALTHIGSSAWCRWHDSQLALIASTALFQAPGADMRVTAAPLLAVLQHADLALGVPVQAVLRLEEFGPGVPSTDGVGENIIDASGATVLLVDVTRLLARHPEAALARGDSVTATASAKTITSTGTVTSNAEAYIVFDAAGLQALPLAAIEQIVPLDVPLSATMAWQGVAIPLIDLRGEAPDADGADGTVLVAQGAHGLAGHIVRRVQALIPAGAGRMFNMGANGTEFITTDDGAQEATYRIATLSALQAAN
jgi:chemotaxis signal transduction protein